MCRAPMQTYPVKPGHVAKVDLPMVFDACFDAHTMDGDWLCGRYGSMPQIKVRYDGKKAFVVDTVTDKGLALKVAAGDKEALQMATETQRRWNEFLESATGYDAKMRKKKMEEAAKKTGGDVPKGM
jgi:hypothetical protein